MQYKPDFGPRAAERLWQVNPRLGWMILDAVDELCDRPAELSKRFYFPHGRDYQGYETRIVDGGAEYLLRIIFHYAPDEQHLLIADLVLTPLNVN